MNMPVRVPGPVDDEAQPIYSTDSGVLDSTPDNTFDSKVDRNPGEVMDSAEVIEEHEKLAAEPNGRAFFEHMESSPWTVVFWLLALTFFCWFLSDAMLTILEAFEQSWWFGSPLALVTTLLLLAFGWAVHREWIAWQHVDQLAQRQAQINKAIESNNLYDMREALEPTLENIRKRHPGLIREFENAAEQRDTSRDYFKQYENIVLTVLDKQADVAIKRAVLMGSAGVAISPHPALDAVIVLWRASRVDRRIRQCIRSTDDPGYFY